MSEPPSPLPAGVWAETFAYSSGRTEIIYKRALSEEGPHLRADDRGARCLLYMYGHWVFIWSEISKATVDIAFGAIDSHHVEHREVSITGDWNPENLIKFGRRWRRQLIAQYAP